MDNQIRITEALQKNMGDRVVVGPIVWPIELPGSEEPYRMRVILRIPPGMLEFGYKYVIILHGPKEY